MAVSRIIKSMAQSGVTQLITRRSAGLFQPATAVGRCRSLMPQRFFCSTQSHESIPSQIPYKNEELHTLIAKEKKLTHELSYWISREVILKEDLILKKENYNHQLAKDALPVSKEISEGLAKKQNLEEQLKQLKAKMDVECQRVADTISLSYHWGTNHGVECGWYPEVNTFYFRSLHNGIVITARTNEKSSASPADDFYEIFSLFQNLDQEYSQLSKSIIEIHKILLPFYQSKNYLTHVKNIYLDVSRLHEQVQQRLQPLYSVRQKIDEQMSRMKHTNFRY